jgi:4-diphosphocytidyl-2-C-methyl-D-erythritol kinase
VLVNPGAACPTPPVFAALERRDGSPLPALPGRFADAAALLDYLFATRNDLEAPARRLVPVIGEALEALAASGAALARMSGSGATCFGLFETEAAALSAAEHLRRAAPAWWVSAAPID